MEYLNLFLMKNLPDTTLYQIRQCTRENCRLRFSIEVADRRGEHCPLCRAVTLPVGEPYGQALVGPSAHPASGPQLAVLLDNIRSAWNVGSMLRTADGAGVHHAYLGGVSATPANPKVAKTALGAEKSMSWSFHPDAFALAKELRAGGLRLWALEGGERAISLFDSIPELTGPPIVLVVGNELTGVDPGILSLCERVVSLPMLGMKGSLNVAVAFGIAVYTIRFAVPVLP